MEQVVPLLPALGKVYSVYFTVAYCLIFILQEGHPMHVYDTVDLSYTDYIFLNISQTPTPQACSLICTVAVNENIKRGLHFDDNLIPFCPFFCHLSF